jgi:hypothetical protein
LNTLLPDVFAHGGEALLPFFVRRMSAMLDALDHLATVKRP